MLLVVNRRKRLICFYYEVSFLIACDKFISSSWAILLVAQIAWL